MSNLTARETYVFLDEDTVAGVDILIEVKGGEGIRVSVPVPNCPDDKRDQIIRQLVQKSAPMIRSNIKKQFGTTKYRVVGLEMTTYPASQVLAQHDAMFPGRMDA